MFIRTNRINGVDDKLAVDNPICICGDVGQGAHGDVASFSECHNAAGCTACCSVCRVALLSVVDDAISAELELANK